MKLTKCDNGHFYDGDKHTACPYCRDGLDTPGIVAEVPRAAPAPTGAPAGPVTGWLVVLDGPARGRDLRLGVGRTLLGVDDGGLPATLHADAALSLRQAALVCDPRGRAFTLLPGSSQELVYLDGEALLAPCPLTGGETLRMAGAALRFVPFEGAFGWDGEE